MEEVGLLASLKPEVDDGAVRQEREKLERDLGETLEVDVAPGGLEDLRDAQEDALSDWEDDAGFFSEERKQNRLEHFEALGERAEWLMSVMQSIPTSPGELLDLGMQAGAQLGKEALQRGGIIPEDLDTDEESDDSDDTSAADDADGPDVDGPEASTDRTDTEAMTDTAALDELRSQTVLLEDIEGHLDDLEETASDEERRGMLSKAQGAAAAKVAGAGGAKAMLAGGAATIGLAGLGATAGHGTMGEDEGPFDSGWGPLQETMEEFNEQDAIFDIPAAVDQWQDEWEDVSFSPDSEEMEDPDIDWGLSDLQDGLESSAHDFSETIHGVDFDPELPEEQLQAIDDWFDDFEWPELSMSLVGSEFQSFVEGLFELDFDIPGSEDVAEGSDATSGQDLQDRVGSIRSEEVFDIDIDIEDRSGRNRKDEVIRELERRLDQLEGGLSGV